MTSPAGFIDFFVLEASEYIEHLDGLMHRAGGGVPDGADLQRTARALRGAATMAKLTPFAELASAIEGIGRATRDDVVEWTPYLRAAMVGAIDDLKILVRSARSWGGAETQRAETRTRELATFAPALHSGTTAPTPPSSPSYLVGETNNVAAGLELLVTRPDNRASAGVVLSRVRALRGVAGIRDAPPLADVIEAAENAARPLELGEARLSPERVDLLRAAGALLRRIANALREGAPTSAPSPEYDRFLAAYEALEAREEDGARIVPIDSLFFDDGGPQVLSRAANPPTSRDERFHLEATSQAEHLKALVAEARGTPDPQARERLRRELRRALRALRLAAESFGSEDVVELIASHANAADTIDDDSLAMIERIVQTIAYPHAPMSPSAPTPIVQARAIPEFEAMPPAHPTPPTPQRRPTPPRGAPIHARTPTPPVAIPVVPVPRRPTPAPVRATPARPTPTRQTPVRPTPAAATPAAGASALDQGIANLDAFSAQPFAEPAPVHETVVPIDALVYRGRAAVQRAIQIREQIRQMGGPPSPALLNELFELLDLALAE